MEKELLCPVCKGPTLHLEDSVYKCSNKQCGFLGRGIGDEIAGTGPGKGLRCLDCPVNSPPKVFELSKDKYIWALLDMLVLRNKINTNFG
jgi:hypothetical protein